MIIKPKRWTEEQLNFLKNNYKTMSFEELEKELGKSVSAIKQKAYDLQLTKKFWSAEQIKFLKSNYEEMSIEELEVQLGKTANAIKLKASRLGIHKYGIYK